MNTNPVVLAAKEYAVALLVNAGISGASADFLAERILMADLSTAQDYLCALQAGYCKSLSRDEALAVA